jgi:hypothetical protein
MRTMVLLIGYMTLGVYFFYPYGSILLPQYHVALAYPLAPYTCLQVASMIIVIVLAISAVYFGFHFFLSSSYSSLVIVLEYPLTLPENKKSNAISPKKIHRASLLLCHRYGIDQHRYPIIPNRTTADNHVAL